MNSAIEDLILQNSSFMDNIPYNEKYWQLLEEGGKLYNRLKETLNDEQIELLNEFINNNLNSEAEVAECNLLHGFKTAMRLMKECL